MQCQETHQTSRMWEVTSCRIKEDINSRFLSVIRRWGRWYLYLSPSGGRMSDSWMCWTRLFGSAQEFMFGFEDAGEYFFMQEEEKELTVKKNSVPSSSVCPKDPRVFHNRQHDNTHSFYLKTSSDLFVHVIRNMNGRYGLSLERIPSEEVNWTVIPL